MKILTDEQLEKLIKICAKEAFEYYLSYIKKSGVISELKRLKQDHWDKDAFDRLMKILSESPHYNDR